MIETILSNRDEFRAFLLKRNPSQKFIATYIRYITSPLVRSTITELFGEQKNVFELEYKDLYVLYQTVKANPNNIRLHNVYSGAISAYMKFLKGDSLRAKVGENKEQSETLENA